MPDAFVEALDHRRVARIAVATFAESFGFRFEARDLVGLSLNGRVHGIERQVEKKRTLPIVFDELGNHHGVDENALPVRLPDLVDYEPVVADKPQPLLAKARRVELLGAGEAIFLGDRRDLRWVRRVTSRSIRFLEI